MSPLEIDFERYQRRIAELEADKNRLRQAVLDMSHRAEKAEAEVERLQAAIRLESLSNGVYHANPSGSQPIIHPASERCFLCGGGRESGGPTTGKGLGPVPAAAANPAAPSGVSPSPPCERCLNIFWFGGERNRPQLHKACDEVITAAVREGYDFPAARKESDDG